MARNDAKEVERQYYEFKRRMEQKKASSSAPADVKKSVKRAAPASQKAPVKPTGKTNPPVAEEDKKAAVRLAAAKHAAPEADIRIEEIAPVEVAHIEVEETAAQIAPVSEGPEAQTSPAEEIAEEIAEETEDSIAAEDEAEEASGENDEESDEDDEDSDVDDEDSDGDDEDSDGDDESEEEEEEQSGVLDAVRSAGSRLIGGISGLASSLSGRIRSLKPAKAEDDGEDFDSMVEAEEAAAAEENAFDLTDETDEASGEAAPEEDDFSEEAPAEEAPAEEAPEDAEDIFSDDSAEEGEPAEDLTEENDFSGEAEDVFSEEYDEEEVEDADKAEDEEETEDEADSPSAFSRLFTRIRQILPSRKAASDEPDEEAPEEEAEYDTEIAEDEAEKAEYDADAAEIETEEAEYDADAAEIETEEAEYDAEVQPETVDVPEDFGEEDEFDDDEFDDIIDDDDSYESLYGSDESNSAESGEAPNPNDTNDQEGDLTAMDNNNSQKSMTQLMSEGLNDTPTLSRRERRMLAEAAEAKKPAPAVNDDLDLLDDAEDDKDPTQEYEMVRAKKEAAKKSAKKPVVLPDDDGDDEDDEDEEILPKKKQKVKASKKRPVFDEEDEDDEDEYDEYDEDDEDDDDEYDDEEDDEEEESFGHRVLGFFKGLIALILLLLIVVFGLQVAEKGGHISLDWVREKVGSSIPFVNTIFPEPADQGENMPN